MKVQSLERLEEWRASLRSGQKVVWTNGVFDLFHVGHLRTLQFAARQGLFLVVGINSDASTRLIKPFRPIVPEEQRVAIVEGLEVVDYVTLLDARNPCALIRRLRPDVCVKGGEYVGKVMPEMDAITQVGAKLVFAPTVEGMSTTELVRRIQMQMPCTPSTPQ